MGEINDQKQLTRLQKDLAGLKKEIASAEEKDSLYSGGLIKSLIAMRLEILQISKALLEQRMLALENDVAFEFTLPTTKPDPEKARRVWEELSRARQELAAAKKDAARYSGGLVHAMKHSTIATQEQTIAMLAQQFFTAKYGLALPKPKQSQPETEMQGSANSASEPPPVEEKPSFKVVDIASRVTERNRSWSKFAWKLTVKNESSHAMELAATIEFQDSDGFVVDDDQAYGLMLRPHQTETFTGYALIDADIVRQVSRVEAKVQRTS